MDHKPTISLAAAAEKLATNILVIQRWIDAGYIQVVAAGPKGEQRVLQAPFEAQCEAIREWLRGFADADEEGYTRASVREMEEFWQSRPPVAVPTK